MYIYIYMYIYILNSIWHIQKIYFKSLLLYTTYYLCMSHILINIYIYIIKYFLCNFNYVAGHRLCQKNYVGLIRQQEIVAIEILFYQNRKKDVADLLGYKKQVWWSYQVSLRPKKSTNIHEGDRGHRNPIFPN